MTDGLQAAKSRIERIHKSAIDAMNAPRVPPEVRAILKKIAAEAMATCQLLNEPNPKKREFFQAARTLIALVVSYFRRRDGP